MDVPQEHKVELSRQELNALGRGFLLTKDLDPERAAELCRLMLRRMAESTATSGGHVSAP